MDLPQYEIPPLPPDLAKPKKSDPFAVAIWILIAGSLLGMFFPFALWGAALTRLGYVLWLPWPFFIYSDFKASKAGKLNVFNRIFHSTCFASVIALITHKVLLVAYGGLAGTGADFVPWFDLAWVSCMTGAFALYASIKFSTWLFIPISCSPCMRTWHNIQTPVVYLVIYTALLVSTVYLSAVDPWQESPFEIIMILAMGMVTLVGILCDGRIFSLKTLSITAHASLLGVSLAGLLLCYITGGFRRWVPELRGYDHQKPHIILLFSIGFTGLSLLVSILRKTSSRGLILDQSQSVTSHT